MVDLRETGITPTGIEPIESKGGLHIPRGQGILPPAGGVFESRGPRFDVSQPAIPGGGALPGRPGSRREAPAAPGAKPQKPKEQKPLSAAEVAAQQKRKKLMNSRRLFLGLTLTTAAGGAAAVGAGAFLNALGGPGRDPEAAATSSPTASSPPIDEQKTATPQPPRTGTPSSTPSAPPSPDASATAKATGTIPKPDASARPEPLFPETVEVEYQGIKFPMSFKVDPKLKGQYVPRDLGINPRLDGVNSTSAREKAAWIWLRTCYDAWITQGKGTVSFEDYLKMVNKAQDTRNPNIISYKAGGIDKTTTNTKTVEFIVNPLDGVQFIAVDGGQYQEHVLRIILTSAFRTGFFKNGQKQVVILFNMDPYTKTEEALYSHTLTKTAINGLTALSIYLPRVHLNGLGKSFDWDKIDADIVTMAQTSPSTTDPYPKLPLSIFTASNAIQ